MYLDDDLTPAQQATRRSLAGEYQKLKMAKLRPFYRQDRLLYVHRGKVVQHQAGRALPTGSPAPQGTPTEQGPSQAVCPSSWPRAATGVQAAWTPLQASSGSSSSTAPC